jgi:glycosyltransferase involved in cell wall biosynthesis
MSNALLEAMAYGMPCIASRIGGNSDLIHDGQNGRLVHCHEADELAQAIISLIDDGNWREQFGQAARQTIERNFSMEHIAQRYMALYYELSGNTLAYS